MRHKKRNVWHTQALSTLLATDDSLVSWQGRHMLHYNGSCSFDWPGTQFTVTIRNGTFLAASFGTGMLSPISRVKMQVLLADAGACEEDENCTIPGGFLTPHAEVVLARAQTSYVLAAGLPSHATIKVVNSNAPDHMVGPLTLTNLSTDGAFVPPVVPSVLTGRRIEFIGDSITSGALMRRPQGDPEFGIPSAPDCADSGLYTDFTRSFPYLLCSALDAQCSTIAKNGLGLYMNCCGKGGRTMPDYYTRSLALMEDKYNFTEPPQAIVINIGTNDWSGCNETDPMGDNCGELFEKGFAERYASFLVNITRWYQTQDIKFFLVVGPIIGDYLGGTHMAADFAQQQGLDTLVVDAFVCDDEGGGCSGCNRHPNSAEHKKMFERLYKPIKDSMDW